MNLIYTPRGRAAEYAELALNIYNGCTHGCRYCYAPKAPYIDADKYFTDPAPKKDFLQRLRKDCETLHNRGPANVPEILLSFHGDVYQPCEMDFGLTRAAIKILIEYSLPFTILTKGGTRAIRDFDLLEKYDRCSFGTSLSMLEGSEQKRWEPNAPHPCVRIETLALAKDHGIRTWVSLEPVIDPGQAVAIVERCHFFVDHWKVGKLNYFKPPQPVDWKRFREDVVWLLEGLDADYYIKNSLRDL